MSPDGRQIWDKPQNAPCSTVVNSTNPSVAGNTIDFFDNYTITPLECQEKNPFFRGVPTWSQAFFLHFLPPVHERIKNTTAESEISRISNPSKPRLYTAKSAPERLNDICRAIELQRLVLLYLTTPRTIPRTNV